MNKRLLVLNVSLSGVNKYLFGELIKRGWDYTMINVPYPKRYHYWAMVTTFGPDIAKWKESFHRKMRNIKRSSGIFKSRSYFCHKKIGEAGNQYEIIFQISGTFAPTLDYQQLRIPFVTFNDYTMALSQKYTDWTPLPSEAKKWTELERELYQNARWIFVPSENTRRSFIDDYGIQPEKVVKVGYGMTLDDIPNARNEYDGKTILYVGYDFKRKGGYVLLEAFRKVKEKIKDARLVIVGPNRSALKVDQPGVEMLGGVEDREMVKSLYGQASVFVMPSFCEPFGLVFLEAMGYKLPCIGSNVDAIPEIIEDGKTGFLVPPGDVDSLTEKICILLKDRELSANMGFEGYYRLKGEFRWDIVGEKIDTRLNELILPRS